MKDGTRIKPMTKKLTLKTSKSKTLNIQGRRNGTACKEWNVHWTSVSSIVHVESTTLKVSFWKIWITLVAPPVYLVKCGSI